MYLCNNNANSSIITSSILFRNLLTFLGPILFSVQQPQLVLEMREKRMPAPEGQKNTYTYRNLYMHMYPVRLGSV